MYNENFKVADECGCVPAPAESMKDVIADLHDKMMKARAMSEDISGKLFGIDPMKEGAACDGNCAYDALCDTRRIANYMLETLYAVIQRIEG